MAPVMRADWKWFGMPAGRGCGHGCETLLARCFQAFLVRKRKIIKKAFKIEF